MSASSGFRRAFRFAFGKPTPQSDIEEEFAFHLDSVTAELVEAGMDPNRARAEAVKRFGSAHRYRKACLAIGQRHQVVQQRQEYLSNLLVDLKFAFRMFRRSPLYTATALITLAIGIGANTSIFSLVNAVLLRPLPYEEPDRIVRAWANFEGGSEAERVEGFSYRVIEYEELRRASKVFSVVGAEYPMGVTLTGGAEPERVTASLVTPGYFEVFGTPPSLGRTFTQRDLDDGNDRIALVSHGFWERRLDAEPEAIGRGLTLDGEAFTVIGVLPENFTQVEGESQVFYPYNVGTKRWIGRWLNLYGKLRPGTNLSQAEQELNLMLARLGESEERSAGWTASVEPLHQMVVGDVRAALLALLATVAFILLISCVNVANLSLARTTSREREMKIRMALGAGRSRIIRQVLVESVLLATFGGAAGVLLAYWGVKALTVFAPADIPRLEGVTIDPLVLAFTFGVSVLAGLIFGMAPALHAAVGGSLAGHSRGTSGSREGQRVLGFLVVTEVALAMVLLVSAGLMLKSFSRLLEVDVGFNRSNVLVLRLDVPSKYERPHGVNAFYDQVSERLAALPGVRSVGLGADLPLSGRGNLAFANSEDNVRAGVIIEVSTLQRVVTPEFFRTLQVPLLAGRTFTTADGPDAPEVLVINETLARMLWPGEDAVGKRLTRRRNPDESSWREVIGVVGDVRYQGMENDPQPTYYQAQAQASFRDMFVFLRSGGDPGALVQPARKTVHALDPDVPVYDVTSLERVVNSSLASPRFTMLLFAMFGLVALFLASAGIYGVLSYVVTQRNHEIAIRMAMGASQISVAGMLLRRGMTLVVAGCVLGAAGALASTQVIRNLLYTVSPTDTATFIGVAVVLAATALAACYLPARRASRLDPAVVLREQ